MPEIIDNAGSSTWARLSWQTVQQGPWLTFGLTQRTSHLRDTLRKAIESGKAPKHAYRIEAAEALHPMPNSVKMRLRKIQQP